MATSSSRSPSLSAIQKTLTQSFKNELNVLLLRKNKITQLISERGDALVFRDKAIQILKNKGYNLQDARDKSVIIDRQQTLIRDGSLKPKGWQVTFRGSTSKPLLQAGTGYLLMRRGPLLLIPLAEIKEFLLELNADVFARETVDIFIRFDENEIFLAYRKFEMKVTVYAILPYPEK